MKPFLGTQMENPKSWIFEQHSLVTPDNNGVLSSWTCPKDAASPPVTLIYSNFNFYLFYCKTAK